MVPFTPSNIYLLIVLPLPALLDWVFTTFTEHQGYNSIRTTTGTLLGYGYSIGLLEIFLNFDLRVVLLGIIYAFVAGILLWCKENSASFK